MIDLSRPWPLGLGEKRWWVTAAAALALLAVAAAFDQQFSQFAQGWPAAVQSAMTEVTRYGQSDWILYPSAFLYVLTALVALFVRWKLMRTMLWQFAALYAFIFVGVAVPSIVTNLIKRLIGRGRPVHLTDTGLFGLHWNWADWTYQSFPSGHATTAFALAAVIGFVSERWFYPALVLAVAIGVSRVSLGLHYPSDVVAGAIVGLIGAYAVRIWFAQRGWLFRRDTSGRIHGRAMSSLKRYLTLKRRGTVRAQLPSRP